MSLKLLIYEIIPWIKPHFNNSNDKLDEKKSTIDETDKSCDHLLVFFQRLINYYLKK